MQATLFTDKLNAFCRHASVQVDGAAQGPLQGLTFAAKDIYDVEGEVCCCGNPDWLASHEPAEATAPVVAALLAAGADLRGKTLTDEIAFSLNGQNFHYGTPRNSAAPDRTLMARDELRRVQAALDRLPAREREAILLGRVEGLSRREIALRMGIAESAVAQYLSRGIRGLVNTLCNEPPTVRRKS